MSNKVTELLTPVGRLVQGDCFEAQTTDAEGKPLVVKNGPNAGQPRVDYFMAIAIPKTDPGFNELYAKIHNEARQSFPSLFDQAGNCISPKFAFKVIDGDSQVPNSRGTKPCDREGFPGHWVLNFSGGYAPKCYTAGGAELITDPNMIKRGYYIRIYGSVKGNGSTQQPGIFLNHSMVELVGYGEEIITGPDGSAVFGGTPAGALPAGASATPVAPSTAPLAQGPGAAPASPQPGGAPAAAAPAAPATPAAAHTPAQPAPGTVSPAPDFLNGPGGQPAGAPASPAAPAAPAADPAAPAAPAEPMYYDANGAGPFKKSDLEAAGYTEAHFANLQQA